MDDDNDDPWEDEYWEPIGSCEECGVDIYADDDDWLCGQCAWWVQEANRDED